MVSDRSEADAGKPVEVGLSLGSNFGNRLAHLREARQRVALLRGVSLEASSPVYETEPIGVRDEYRHMAFLNAVLILLCSLPAKALSDAIHTIEDELGRVRGEDRYAPRTIDIDVLYFGQVEIAHPELTVPHPSWTGRRFVVQPLADVRPDLVLPGEIRTCRQILCSLPPKPEAVRLIEQW